MQTWAPLKSGKILFRAGVVVLGVFVAAAIGYKVALRGKPVPPMPVGRLSRQNPEHGGERAVLDTMSSSSIERNHVLDGSFTIIRLTGEIAKGCRDIFDSSFVPGSGPIELADPGELFQFSDALIEGAPFRRLEFAGMAPNKCFIYYQHGGTMYPRFCLALMDNSNRKMLWVGVAAKHAANVQELRKMLLRGDFADNNGPTC